MVRELYIILILIFLMPSAIHPIMDSINQYLPSPFQLKSTEPVILQNTTEIIETEATKSKVEINPDNQDVKNYFQKVADVPYKADYISTKPKNPAQFWKDNFGDCDDKSIAFADYLYNIGAEDVKVVVINHESNKYAHACIMWKGKIFDATAKPPIYDMDPDRYFNFLEKQGFTLRITYSYEPKN